MHTLKLYYKNQDGSKIEEFGVSNLNTKSKANQPKVTWDLKYTKDSDSMIKIRIGDGTKSVIKPGEEIMITFSLTKALRNFEEYPNDVSRGFNIPHMPVYYKFEKATEFEMIYSNSMLM